MFTHNPYRRFRVLLVLVVVQDRGGLDDDEVRGQVDAHGERRRADLLI